MTKHSVSTASKDELIGLCDEIVARLDVADDALREFAQRRHVGVESLSPAFVEAMRGACLSDLTLEEVRGAQRAPRRPRACAPRE